MFDVVAPKGSLVNPIDPAPLGLTINAAQRLPDVIFGALADVAGDRDVYKRQVHDGSRADI